MVFDTTHNYRLAIELFQNAAQVVMGLFTQRGVSFTCEFYADLDYDDAGRQVITMTHDPVAPDVAARKVLRAIREGKTRSLGGRDVDVVAETICVHSDAPGALEVARAVHAALKDHLAA